MVARPRPEHAEVLRELAAEWSLSLGEPLTGGTGSLVVAATLLDSTEAVLKVADPHRESEYEADALERWGGSGAVRLLAADRERGALLVERCRPGTPLDDLSADEALDVVTVLLPRLWIRAGEPFRPLADEASWWASDLPGRWEHFGRPFERRLLELVLEALRDLPPSQGELVLVNQDLHAGNVLRAEREPWLVIDPKPLVGEREFSLAPLVRGRELGHSRADVLGRLDRLSGELGLDRERARLWSIAQTVAWSFDDAYQGTHIEVARWLAEA